jgi:hypothetical protein
MDPGTGERTVTTRTSSHPRIALLTLLVGVALMVLHAALTVVGARTLGCTVDEPNYYNAGHLIAERGFVHEITTLQGPVPLQANQWFAGEFPAGGLAREPLDRSALFRGRLGTVPFSILLTVVTFLWARALFGDRGGLLALALVAVDPVLVGYGSTLLVDTAHAAFTLLALFLTWSHLRDGSRRTLPWIGVAVGLALATKYLAVFLALPVGVLVLGRALRGPGARARRAATSLSIVVGCAFLALHTAYGFPGLAPTDPGAYGSAFLSGWAALPGAGRLAALFPGPFLRGIDFQQLQTARSWSPYLNGVFAPGHPTSYLWALATKLPEIALVCLGLGAVRMVRRLRQREAADGWSAALLVGGAYGVLVLGFLSLATNMQLGIRYVLPLVPLLLLPAGALLWNPARTGLDSRVGVLLALVVAAHAVELTGSAPDWLAYYNRVSGGQRLAYRRFIDTSSDFGQYELSGPGLLRERHPEVQVLGPYSGPRFGLLAIDAVALRAQDPDRPERSRFHWLIGGAGASDHLAASWWVFEVTPEALEARVAEVDDPVLRRDLAIAYLGAGRRADAERHLARLDDAVGALPRRLIAAQDAVGTPSTSAQLDRLARAWRVVGRPDRVEALAHEHPQLASGSDIVLYGRVQALEERREYLAAKDLALSAGSTADAVLFRLYLDLGRVGAHRAADELFGAIEARTPGSDERGLRNQIEEEQARRADLLDLLR